MSTIFPNFSKLYTASQVSDAISFLFPGISSAELHSFARNKVLHSVAVAKRQLPVGVLGASVLSPRFGLGNGSKLVVIKINEKSPPSIHDFFMLNLVHALSDVVLTTGQILREEPKNHTDIQGPFAKGLKLWREEVLKLSGESNALVLTQNPSEFDLHLIGRELDEGRPHHVVFTDCDRVFRSPAMKSDRTSSVVDFLSTLPTDFFSEEKNKKNLSLLLSFLASKLSVCIDCGPSTTVPIYQSVLDDLRRPDKNLSFAFIPDVLFLSVYQGESFNDACVGKDFITEEDIHLLYEEKSKLVLDDWTFYVFIKRLKL